jgi:hypothetical protein
MKRYAKLFAGAVIVMTALGSSCARTKPGVEEFEKRLDLAIPTGTSLNQVLVVLDSMRLPHSDYDPRSRTLRARLAEPSNHIVSRTIQVTFHFDASQRLVSREVRERFTGP